MDLFDELFNEIWNDFGSFMSYKTGYKEEKKCPKCSRTLADFKRTSRLGCDECYKTFHDEIAGVLRQIHANDTHNGKIPSKSGNEIKLKRKKEELKAKLSEAVKAENYEEAARLHKEIKSLEE